MDTIQIALYGDASLSKREFETAPGLQSRMSSAVWGSWYSTAETTGIQRMNYDIVMNAIPDLIKELEAIEAIQMEVKNAIL